LEVNNEGGEENCCTIVWMDGFDITYLLGGSIVFLCLSCFGWTKLDYPTASYELRSDILVFVFGGAFLPLFSFFTIIDVVRGEAQIR